jgi:hypothetical protein
VLFTICSVAGRKLLTAVAGCGVVCGRFFKEHSALRPLHRVELFTELSPMLIERRWFWIHELPGKPQGM